MLRKAEVSRVRAGALLVEVRTLVWPTSSIPPKLRSRAGEAVGELEMASKICVLALVETLVVRGNPRQLHVGTFLRRAKLQTWVSVMATKVYRSRARAGRPRGVVLGGRIPIPQ